MRNDTSWVFYSLLALGCALLPFSTSPEDGGVLAFGLPFLVGAAAFAVPLSACSLRVIDGPAVFLAAAFVLMISLTALFAPNFLQSSVRVFANWVGFLLYMGCLSIFANGRYPVERVARLCLLSCFILAAYFIINFAYASLIHGLAVVVVERYVGGLMSLPWGATNTIAQVLLLAFVMYAILRTKGGVDLLFMSIIAIAITLTFSRSVIMLMLMMSLIVFRLRSVAIFMIFAVFAVVLLFVGGWLSYSDFEVLIEDRLDPAGLATGGGRLAAVQEKLEYFASNPLAPIGYYGSLATFELSAHNYWVTTLVEQSVLGVAVSLAFFLYVAAAALGGGGRVFFAYAVVMLGLMVEDPHFTQPYIVLFWLMLALLVSQAGQGFAYRRREFLPS